eukprot:6183616-Pleurochrysis_carterae.AAC.3
MICPNSLDKSIHAGIDGKSEERAKSPTPIAVRYDWYIDQPSEHTHGKIHSSRLQRLLLERHACFRETLGANSTYVFSPASCAFYHPGMLDTRLLLVDTAVQH